MRGFGFALNCAAAALRPERRAGAEPPEAAPRRPPLRRRVRTEGSPRAASARAAISAVPLGTSRRAGAGCAAGRQSFESRRRCSAPSGRRPRRSAGPGAAALRGLPGRATGAQRRWRGACGACALAPPAGGARPAPSRRSPPARWLRGRSREKGGRRGVCGRAGIRAEPCAGRRGTWTTEETRGVPWQNPRWAKGKLRVDRCVSLPAPIAASWCTAIWAGNDRF